MYGGFGLVYYNTSGNNTWIGMGEVLLRKWGVNVSNNNNNVEWRGKICDWKEGLIIGRIVVLFVLLRSLPLEWVDSEIILPPDFTSSIVDFNRIRIEGLKNK